MLQLKKRLVLIVLTSLCIALQAQGSLELQLTIVDGKLQKMAGIPVEFKEASTGEVLKKTSDANGLVNINLTSGNLWRLYIKGYDSKAEFKVPPMGIMRQKHTETYLPEFFDRLAKQTKDRKNFTVVNAQYTQTANVPEAGKALLVLKVANTTGVKQAGVAVVVVSLKEKKIYKAVTDNTGMAKLQITPGFPLDIDVGTELNNDYCDIVRQAGVVVTKSLTYTAATFVFVQHGDTMEQSIRPNEKPASGYAYYEVTVKKDGVYSKNTNIYLTDIHSTRVFQTRTDASGVGRFQLPQGAIYMIHFDFERDVDVINLKNAFGESQGSISVNYRPDPRLEHPESFIPGADRLFLTDIQSFLQKQYPVPQKNVGLHLQFLNSINANSREAVLELGVNAGTPGVLQLPLNIAFVLDRSGSMSGYERLESVKEAMKKVVQSLPATAKISIILFDDETRVLLPHGLLPSNKNNLIQEIEKIEAGGGTDMLEALRKAYAFVTANASKNSVNRVLVLTDGYDNNPVEKILEVQKSFGANIECSAFGIGDGYNASLLELMVKQGKGKLYATKTADKFNNELADFILGNVQPAAVDVTVEVEYNQQIVFKHLLGYNPVLPAGNPVRFKLPNLYSGNQQVALVKFDLNKPSKEIENKPVTVRVKYINPHTALQEMVEEKVYLKWNDYTGEIELIAEAHMKKLYAVTEINRGIKLMSEQYAAGNTAQAEAQLKESMEYLQKLYPTVEDADLLELKRSMEQYTRAFKQLAANRAKGYGK